MSSKNRSARSEVVSTATSSIPTTLLCGFLGSGKTTRINRMIRDGALANALFLVNDFGRINIDAELIDSRDDHILRLTNGCACCGIAGNLSAQLRDIRLWPERPEHLVFEASGIARPRPLLQMLDAADGYRLEQGETLVDASAFARHYDDPAINDIVAAQIREVTNLRINRIDWLNPLQRQDVLERIVALNPKAQAILEEAGHPPPHAASGTALPHGASAPVTKSVWLTQRIDIAALDALLRQAMPCLLRAKGLVEANDDAGTRYLVQLSGGRVIRTATRAGKSQALVVIGYPGGMLDTLLAALRRL